MRLLRDVLDEQVQKIGYSGLPLALREQSGRLQPVIDLEAVLTHRFKDALLFPSSPHFSSLTGNGRTRRPYEVTVGSGGVWKMLQSSTRKVSSRHRPNAPDVEEARKLLAERMNDIVALARHPVVQELLAKRSRRLEHLPG